MSTSVSVVYPEDLSELRALYAQARFLDAYALLGTFAPPEMWPGAEGRILAGRLLENLGASRRAGNLLRATWQAHPDDPEARYYYALDLAGRHGPFEALRFIESIQPEDTTAFSFTTSSRSVAHLSLLRARLLAYFRDFEAAEVWLQAVLAALPEDAWARVEEASIRQSQDRLDDAVRAIDRAHQLRPGYRPAVGMGAHLLILQNRDTEAMDLLRRALQTMQAGALTYQLAGLLIEHERFGEAAEALMQSERFYPLAEKGLREWLRGRQADVLYRLGNYNEALAAARQVSGRYYESVAERLDQAVKAASLAKRVQLKVEFIRQHHMTCAPATISALSVYWGKPIDHLALAQVITYDGTPDHEERHWLENHGWLVREFRVTWDTAKALLDRGVPFTLVTTWVRSAHLQAVTGYDDTLGLLIIRDPSHRAHSEALAAELLEQQSPHGPRGMVLLPPEEAARLEGLELPEAGLYDEYYRLRRALVRHDRSAAEQAGQRLETLAPGHRLSWHARREFAYYDDNPLRVQEAVEALRKLYPAEPNLRLEELSVLSRLGRRAERLERLREFAHARGADPVFWRDYAEELRTDARENRRAMRYARRLMRARPLDWLNLLTFGHLLWGSGEFKTAARVYRLAATIGEKVETPWNVMCSAFRLTGQTELAVELLRARWERLGSASAFPTQTFVYWLQQLGRTTEAHGILDRALEQRPQDGDLLTFASDVFSQHGQVEKARGFLQLAETRTSKASWLHATARLASRQGEHAIALEHWEKILLENPLNEAGLREVARLVAILRGKDASVAWLTQQVDRFPYFLPLRQLRLEWLRSASPATILDQIDQYLSIEPNDAWAHREKALTLVRDLRLEDALRSAELAEQIDPRSPSSPGVVGQVLTKMRRFSEARAAIERGLRLSIDADWLMQQLLLACPTFEDRNRAVEFIRRELETQASLGQGFLSFHEMATGVVAPAELHRILESLRAAQPGHWEIWAATIQQCVAINKTDDALLLAEQATQRFPMLPRLWLELADVHRARGNIEAEMGALTKTLELSPGWSWPSSRLAGAFMRQAKVEAAADTLRRALRHDPLDARLTTDFARVLWHLGKKTEAADQAERALSLSPAYQPAWSLLDEFARELGDSERVLQAARKLAEARPGDPEPLWRLSQELGGKNRLKEALEQVDAALRLDPLHANSHDYRAVLLSESGEYDQALEACRPAAFEADIPFNLRGRAAWVESRRGNLRGAIAAMKTVLSEHPDYSWGWQCLADWLEQAKEMKAAAEAAERYAAINPHSAYAHGYIADLHLKAGDKNKAADAFRAALRIEPGYLFAALGLLTYACENSQWAEAEQVVALIRHHASHWQALRAEARLLREKRDKAGAVRVLQELGLAPEHETVTFTNAAETLLEAGWSRPLGEAMEANWTAPAANPEVGTIWVRTYRSRGAHAPIARLLKSSAPLPMKLRGLGAYVEELGAGNSQARFLWILWRQYRLLRETDALWGSVGYTLSTFGWRRWLVRWMADWSSRRDIQPWMLYNLANALFDLGREHEAMPIVARALQFPADRTRPTYVAWAAWISAYRGDLPEAKRWLGVFDAPEDFLASKAVAQMAGALVALDEVPAGERREKFSELRLTVAELKSSLPGAYDVRFVRRLHVLTLRRLSALASAPFHAVWYKLLPWRVALN